GDRLECARLVKHEPSVFLKTDAGDSPKGFTGFDPLYDFEERIFALAFHDNVDVRCRQRLVRQQRRMPSAENYWLLRIELLGRACDLHGLLDHRTGDQRDSEAQRIIKFFDDALLEIWSDRGVDDADLVAGVEQRVRQSQDAQRRSRLLARKCREEKNNF